MLLSFISFLQSVSRLNTDIQALLYFHNLLSTDNTRKVSLESSLDLGRGFEFSSMGPLRPHKLCPIKTLVPLLLFLSLLAPMVKVIQGMEF